MENKGTYLSVDLDFWNHVFDTFPYDKARRHMEDFLAKVMQTTDNLRIVDSHEELMKHANLTHKKFGCNKLINVDYHSDIFDRFNPDDSQFRNLFNCGTWINYIDFMKEGEFLWVLPYPFKDAKYRGFCHDGNSKEGNPFFNPAVAGWKKTGYSTAIYPMHKIDWDNVVGAGIAFSYYWLREVYNIDKIAAKVLGYKPRRNSKARIS